VVGAGEGGVEAAVGVAGVEAVPVVAEAVSRAEEAALGVAAQAGVGDYETKRILKPVGAR
jgi:hypothetical protein